jgi:FliI/YscN family ATPase
MNDLIEHINNIFPHALCGSVTQVIGQSVIAGGFPAPLGSTSLIERDCGRPVEAEVIGFQGSKTLLLSHGDFSGIRCGNRVRLHRSSVGVRVGQGLLGRVLNSRGYPIDAAPVPALRERRNISERPLPAMQRPPIDRALATGVKAIDTLLTLGVGQRVGIFSGSGVGKSTLLGQIARTSQADLNVIALVGERGREVREFLERDLGSEGLARSVVVVATGDEPALHRYRAALVATTIAEYFRDLGNNVLLMMDSVTRFALAQREIGFARGEAPVTRGYPPSVFSALPQLLERSGRGETGSITGIYSVLVEGDDMNEPIADTLRGILDGHIVLSRKLANQAHWPAIDVLGSVSRLMTHLAAENHRQAADQVRELLAAYQESEDLILIGAYQQGTQALVDRAIQLRDSIHRLLRQRPEEQQAFEESIKQLIQLMKQPPQLVSLQAANGP